MIDYIQKGGLLMWPILVCSIISIGCLRGASLLFSPRHDSRRRISPGTLESRAAPQFRRGPARMRRHARPGGAGHPFRHHSPRGAARRVARDRAGSRPARGAEAGALPRRARDAGLSRPAHWFVRHSRRDDRSFRDGFLQWRLRHGHGTFDRDLQESSHHRRRARGRDADLCRLQLSFLPGEYFTARHGARRDRSRPYADRSRAFGRDHQLSTGAGQSSAARGER